MPFIYDVERSLLGPLRTPAFVDNLPTEILAEVFANIVTSHSYHYTENVAALLEEEALAFRRASQVSQYWRSVALHQCKNIWGSIINIDTSSSAWVKELISRSKNSPLTIQSLPSRRRTNEDFSGDKWTSVLLQMARIRILHLTLGCQEDATQLMYATSHMQAPTLESFRIGYKCHCALEPRPTLFVFNGRLFDNHCPNLRDFVLARVPFVQPTNHFSAFRLVHLDITPDLFSIGPTVSQWLDVLETQPFLRYLTMVVPSMPGSADANPIFSRQVHLPNLEEISIETPGIEGAQIFASLVLPSYCGIVIQIIESDEEFDHFLLLIQILGEGIQGCVKRWSGKDSAKNSKVESWGLEVGAQYFALRLGSADDEWYNPRIHLHYNCSYDDAGDEEEDILSVLPFFLEMIQKKGIVDAARTCTLEIQFRIMESVGLVDFLSHCTRNVAHLRLLGHSLWLIRGLLRKPDTGTGTAFFPTLNHITLEGPHVVEESMFNYAYQYFERFLHSQAAAGRGIPTTALHIKKADNMHVKFAERAIGTFGSKIETYAPQGAFEEVWEPRYWIGGDELSIKECSL